MIGALRHRVTLSRPQRAEDSGGGTSLAFVDQATVWARIETPRSNDEDRADTLGGRLTHRVTIRHRDDVDVGWRIAWRDRRARVIGARDAEGLRRRLVIDAEEERG